MNSKHHIFLFLLSFAPGIVRAQFNFTATESLSTTLESQTATLLPNGQVLVAGGSDTDNNTLASCELYDPATGTWTNTGSLNTPRVAATATLLPNGKALLVGGYDIWPAELASCELYDPATGTWTNTGSLNTGRLNHTATLLPNGQVLVAGGEDGASDVFDTAELYDPASGTWSYTGSLNNPHTYHTATLLTNGQVLVAGGDYDGNYDAGASCELYDPATGIWTLTGSLNDERDVQTATLLPNGQVLVAGGGDENGAGNALNTAEVYDPATGNWTLTGNLNVARNFPTATLLPDCEVLVVGGGDENFNPIDSAELYNPATGSWTPTGNPVYARASSTATLLPSSQVLLVGGYYDTNYDATVSAELYDATLGLSPVTNSLAVASTIAPRTSNGLFTLDFTNVLGMPFRVLATTNLALPVSNWDTLGVAAELFPGHFQFTDPQALAVPGRFYLFRSP
jgi:N-acetylneuraminic acid mutarotase